MIFPKRLLAFLLFFVLAAMHAGGLRAQWVQINQTDNDDIECFATIGSNVFAGADNVILRSSDSGTSWSVTNLILAPNFFVSSLAVSGTSLFAGVSSHVQLNGSFVGGIYLSTNDGNSWLLDDFGLPATPSGSNYPIKAFGVTGLNIFAGVDSSGIYLSTDDGGIWLPVNGGLLDTVDVYSLATNGKYLFAGSGPYWADGLSAQGIFRSTNNGTNWTPVNNGLPYNTFEYRTISTLAVIGTNLFAGAYGGVYRSTNNGENWTESDSTLTNPLVTVLGVSDTNLFAGTDDGIFLSTNYGANWSNISSGFPEYTYVTAITVSGPYLLAGTLNGVYRRPLSDFGISSVSQTPAAAQPEIQIYPNPLSLSTTITFTSQGSGYAEVSIVNALGTEVAKLYSDELAAGEHSFTWSDPAVCNGMYECLVRMNGAVQSAGIILLR